MQSEETGAMLTVGKTAKSIWMPDWTAVADNELRKLTIAAKEVQQWLHILAKTQDSPVSDLLRGIAQIDLDSYYPEDTVRDMATGCQYFFHAHSDRPQEYGHFHTYVMADGIPASMTAIKPATNGEHHDNSRTHCHLIAVVMSDQGDPVSLFTINQWSSQEACYSVDQIKVLLDRFDISHAAPSYPTNRWISSLVQLMKPQIIQLLEERVRTQKQWATDHPGVNALADENLEVTSQMDISVDRQISGVLAEVKRRSLVEVDPPSTITPSGHPTTVT